MANGDILSDFGINLLEEEIDDVIFQTNEFLTDATFTGAQGPFWWLLVVSENLPLFGYSTAYKPITYKILFRETNPRRDKNGTEPQENKIKNALLRISASEYLLQICPVKNESKRIKFTSIVHFLFSCTTMDNTNRFLPRLDGLAPKSRVKICFVASGSHVRRKCVGLYRHSARSFAGKRKPCIFKYRKLDETDTEKVSDRPTDNLPADGRKSRQMGKLNIYKSIISR